MAKLEINCNRLTSDFDSEMEDAINIIENSIKYFDDISFPYDFNRTTSLKNVIEDVRSCKSKLSSTKSFIKSSASNISSIFSEAEVVVSRMPTNSIKVRMNKIN